MLDVFRVFFLIWGGIQYDHNHWPQVGVAVFLIILFTLENIRDEIKKKG